MITLNVRNTIRQGVKTDSTTAEAWKSLTDVQDLATGMGLLATDSHLCTLWHVNGADLRMHITVMREVWAKTRAQDRKITYGDFQLVIIVSMPKEWNIYVSTLDSFMTSAEVIAKLHSHDALLAHDHKPHALQTIQALVTTWNQTNVLSSYARTPCVARLDIQWIDALDLEEGWQVSIWIGGRKRGNLQPLQHPSHL